MKSAPIARPAMRRRQPAHLQLVGDHHREGELEQVVVAGAEELGPEERREAALAEQRELVRVRVRGGIGARRCAVDGGDVQAGLHELSMRSNLPDRAGSRRTPAIFADRLRVGAVRRTECAAAASRGLARRYCAGPTPPTMSTTQDLVTALKAELRAAGVTYADLADALGMSESSVKRVFAKADMPLSRIDEMLRVLKMDFAELARKVADAQPLRARADASSRRRRWSPTAGCCCSRSAASASGRFEAMTHDYAFSDAECIKYLARLDRLGIIELQPAQPLPAQGREGLSLAAARAGDDATSASTSPPTT